MINAEMVYFTHMIFCSLDHNTECDFYEVFEMADREDISVYKDWERFVNELLGEVNIPETELLAHYRHVLRVLGAFDSIPSEAQRIFIEVLQFRQFDLLNEASELSQSSSALALLAANAHLASEEYQQLLFETSDCIPEDQSDLREEDLGHPSE